MVILLRRPSLVRVGRYAVPYGTQYRTVGRYATTAKAKATATAKAKATATATAKAKATATAKAKAKANANQLYCPCC